MLFRGSEVSRSETGKAMVGQMPFLGRTLLFRIRHESLSFLNIAYLHRTDFRQKPVGERTGNYLSSQRAGYVDVSHCVVLLSLK